MVSERAVKAVAEGPKGVSGDEGATVFDTPEAIDLFALTILRHGLRFEIQTGMQMTGKGSMLKAANRMLGTNYRRKQQALDHLDGLLTALDEEGDN